jgi:hypothetical protein
MLGDVKLGPRGGADAPLIGKPPEARSLTFGMLSVSAGEEVVPTPVVAAPSVLVEEVEPVVAALEPLLVAAPLAPPPPEALAPPAVVPPPVVFAPPLLAAAPAGMPSVVMLLDMLLPDILLLDAPGICTVVSGLLTSGRPGWLARGGVTRGAGRRDGG